MAWTATIVGTRSNPVPTDSVFIDVKFTDGTRSFVKEYQVNVTTDVEALLQAEATQVTALYASLPGLSVTVQGVPETVTMFQCRAALAAMNLLDHIDAAVKTLGGDALLAWEYSPSVHRLSPLVRAVAAQFGLDDAQLDALFVRASGITA